MSYLFKLKEINTFVFDVDGVFTNNTILCGEGGVYRSTDNGNNWTHVNNNLQLTQYYKISINPNSGLGAENVIIGGTQDSPAAILAVAGASISAAMIGASTGAEG